MHQLKNSLGTEPIAQKHTECYVNHLSVQVHQKTVCSFPLWILFTATGFQCRCSVHQALTFSTAVGIMPAELQEILVFWCWTLQRSTVTFTHLQVVLVTNKSCLTQTDRFMTTYRRQKEGEGWILVFLYSSDHFLQKCLLKTHCEMSHFKAIYLIHENCFHYKKALYTLRPTLLSYYH